MPKFLIAALLLASPALAESSTFNERECAGDGSANITACVDHFEALIEAAHYRCNNTAPRDLARSTVAYLMQYDTTDFFFALYPGLDAVRAMAVRDYGDNCR